MALTANLGYPRIGRRRELKRATEAYWQGEIGAADLLAQAAALRRANWQRQQALGIDLIPTGDFSLYDHVLDTIAMVGAVPPRYRWSGETVDLDTYFAMARGAQRPGYDVIAMEMTKWFDTNYHYIVPEFSRGQQFRLASRKPIEEFQEARALGLNARPVLLGPVSFLLLGEATEPGLRPLDLLDALLPVYAQVLQALAAAGATWVQCDEPCFVQDRTPAEQAALTHAYTVLAAAARPARLLVQTYFGSVDESYQTLAALPVAGIGLDFVRGPENLRLLETHGFPADKVLAAGLVDGRNVWRADLGAVWQTLERLTRLVPAERLIVNPSCSLLHVPLDVELETTLDPTIKEALAFADQKLAEVVAIGQALNGQPAAFERLRAANAVARERLRTSPLAHRPAVRQREAALTPADFRRAVPFAERRPLQEQALRLPLLPTTTIGSFPQTDEVRRMRARWRQGKIDQAAYERFIEDQIRQVIALQEEIGLDVLVHGEFERSDMVEYFAEQLEGFAFTTHGWVQSYGTRYVRPPIIYGDVARPRPMTVRWISFAQSLTARPVKGMLTGPVTILNWSFVRDDQPRAETCRQIALALRDEVADLEAAGIRVIQVDEPALREGLPLRRAAWESYLQWAVACFRLTTAGVRPETQIQTHMCYSEFGDIIAAIADMDADVLLIENARSRGELLPIFRQFRYPAWIGPGIYDIHSPRVPSVEEFVEQLRAILAVLPAEQVWVNPDCGLKTRRPEEAVPALRHMVAAAHRLRAERAGVPARR